MKVDYKYLTITRGKIIFTIILGLYLFAVCGSIDEYQKIRQGDFDRIVKGKYPGTLTSPHQVNGYENVVKVLHQEIDKNSDVLVFITKKYFAINENLSFKFKYAAIDKEKTYLVLRYFARTMNHPFYAGYQIQFVFAPDSKRLLQIFTIEVPLE